MSRPVRETAEAIEAARAKGILAVMARADASATIRSSSGGAMMQIGFVYLVFLPSILTTALGGRLAEQFGPRAVAGGALILAALGAPALVLPKTAWFLAALARLAVRTSSPGGHDRLCRSRGAGRPQCRERTLTQLVFSGRLVGSAALGVAFDMAGWGVCVAGVVAALMIAAGLTRRFAVRA